MLVLTRKVGSSIIIGDDIKVTILGTVGASAKVGISAPDSVSVHREEIYKKIQKEKEEEKKLIEK